VLHLEVPKVQQQSMSLLAPMERKQCRDLLVSCFKKLIHEAQQSQLVIDEGGHVVKRYEVEQEFKTVAGAIKAETMP
jgi:hypothetical protein